MRKLPSLIRDHWGRVAETMGLELGGFPYLGQGHDCPLVEGTVLALKPNTAFAGEGSVGIANTVLVSEEGHEVFTRLGEKICQV